MLIKLKSTKGADIYVNADQIAVLSAGTLVGVSNIMLPNGLSIEIQETVPEIISKCDPIDDFGL